MPQGRTRARLLPLLAVSLMSIAMVGAAASASSSSSPTVAVSVAASVAWPVSPDLLIGEVVTGGASANDEYVEIYNAGSVPADLGGLELVYVTASGSTVTRKATWTSRVMQPGRHELVANSAGVFATFADDLYSGGLAATGGAVALRVVGGAVVDSIGWGNATSGFVEGTVAPAPPASQSLERLPGGGLGNSRDTNDNLSDTWIQPLPIPESSGSPAVPGATPTATLSTPSPTPTPTPSPTPTPTSTVTAAPTPMPSSTAAPSPTPTPTTVPTPTVTTAPTSAATASVEPTSAPTSVATPTATPDPATSTPSVEPTSTPAPTASPTQLPTPTAPPPTLDPTPSSTDTPSSTVEPTLQPTATPTVTPTPTPSAAPTPTPVPTPTPTATPTPVPPLSIASARAMAVDATVTVEGVVTVGPGRILGDRVVAIQDATGGICVRLTSDTDIAGLSVGSSVRATGKLAAPYANLEVRLGHASDVLVLGTADVPQPVDGTSESLGEAREGQLLRLTGTLTRVETGSSGALALTVTDSAADARVFLHAALGATRADFTLGSSIAVTGIVGQRESASGLNDGYRLWPRDMTDIVTIAAQPTPTATPTAVPTAAATPTPTPTGTGTTPTPTPAPTPSPTRTPAAPTPTPTPTPTPHQTATPGPSATPMSIAAARALPVGAALTVSGTITVEPGRILGDRVMAIQDGAAGICVHLPSGMDLTAFTRGRVVTVSGVLAAPYANLELRPPNAASVTLGATGSLPAPLIATAAALGEPIEGRLARLTGTLTRIETGSSGSLAIILTDASSGAEARIFYFAPLGATRTDLALGATYAATGLVGQRESASGLNDGYRLWPRDKADVVQVAAPASPTPAPTAMPRMTPSPRPTATPRPTPSPRPSPTASASPSSVPTSSIEEALRHPGATVTVVGLTTTRAGLLDSDNRRVTLQDATGAVLVRLPADAAAPELGTRIRVTGTVGTYYGAPQLDAGISPTILGHDTATPTLLRRVPSAKDEWTLIRVTVRITSVSKNGDAWRAEVTFGAAGAMPVVGLASSGIPSTAMIEGRDAMLTGIVKRAYPTASDQRFALVPRSTADIALGPVPGASPSATASAGGRSPVARSLGITSFPPYPPGSAAASGRAAAGDAAVVSTTIGELGGYVGERVRVGGRVTNVDGPLATLDDGTGNTSVRFTNDSDAAAVALAPQELVNVVGWDAERDLGGLEVVVTAASDVSRAPDLGGPASTDPGAAGDPGAASSAGTQDADEPSSAPSGSDVATANGTSPAAPGADGSAGIVAAFLAVMAAGGLLLLAGSATFVRRFRLLVTSPRSLSAEAVAGPPEPATPPAETPAEPTLDGAADAKPTAEGA